MKKTLMLLALALGFGSAAQATNLIINGNFESGLDHWSYDGVVNWTGPAPYFGGGTPADNGLGMIAFNAGDQTANGQLWQSFATTVGHTYKVSLDYGTNNGNTQKLRTVVSVFEGASLFKDVFEASGPTLSHFDFEFTATKTSTTLGFIDLPANYTFSTDGLLDNVVVTDTAEVPSDVPEPASIALLSLGLAGMGALRRRQR